MNGISDILVNKKKKKPSSVRLKEHLRCVSEQQILKLSIAEHSWNIADDFKSSGVNIV